MPPRVLVLMVGNLVIQICGCQNKVACYLVFYHGAWGGDENHTLSENAAYLKAIELSSNADPASDDVDVAGNLLLGAVGLTKDKTKPPSSIPANVTLHRGILRELAKHLERGTGMPKNRLLSLQFFRQAADLGDPQAHGEMGMRYSYGLHDDSIISDGRISLFEKEDASAAILHFTFGALANDTICQMALGFRHMVGLGVPKNCPTAVSYYNTVAEKVIQLRKTSGPFPYSEAIRLSLRAIQGSRKSREEHMLQYYQYSADLGDVESQAAIGQVFTYGAHDVAQNHQQALHYFTQAAQAGDPGAMSHLGHMYANGLGVKQSNLTAIKWFKKGAAQGHQSGHYGLGYMYLTGYGTDVNLEKAFDHLIKAVELEHPEAQFHLGVMFLKGLHVKPNPRQARLLFTAASQAGHLLAKYNLAMLYLSDNDGHRNCNVALKLLKQVSEQGPWTRILDEGYKSFVLNDYSHALLAYLRAAQMGFELGQSNAAWMLEHNFLPGLEQDSTRIALELYRASASQGILSSLLAIGDIYYYGRGIPKNWKESALMYQQAESGKHTIGAFNLGFMYEFGAGVPKDLLIAKRYYDLSYEYHSDAYYASKLALGFLTCHSWWDQTKAYFPSWLKSLGDKLFTLEYADEPVVAPGWWSGRSSNYISNSEDEGIIGRIMHVLDFDAVSDIFQEMFDIYNDEDIGEIAETVVLGALVVIFLVLFRRQQNNNRQVLNRNQAPLPRRQEAPPAAAGNEDNQPAPAQSSTTGLVPDSQNPANENSSQPNASQVSGPSSSTVPDRQLPSQSSSMEEDKG